MARNDQQINHASAVHQQTDRAFEDEGYLDPARWGVRVESRAARAEQNTAPPHSTAVCWLLEHDASSRRPTPQSYCYPALDLGGSYRGDNTSTTTSRPTTRTWHATTRIHVFQIAPGHLSTRAGPTVGRCPNPSTKACLLSSWTLILRGFVACSIHSIIVVTFVG